MTTEQTDIQVEVPPVSPAPETVEVEEADNRKTWYVWEPVDGGCEEFPLGVFSHTIKQPAGEPQPDNSFEFPPPEAPEGRRIYFLRSAWVSLPEVIDVAPMRQALLTMAESEYKRKMAAGYPEFERATWQLQEQSARAFLKDGTANAFLEELFEARDVEGESMEDFCESVVANADAYNKGLAKTLAEFQNKRLALSKANSIRDLALASGNSVAKLLYYFAPRTPAASSPV